MRFHHLLTLASVALASLLTVTAANPTPPDCNVAITMNGVSLQRNKNTVKQLSTGKTFSVSVTVKNTGSSKLNNLYFQLELPNYLVAIKSVLSKQASLGSSEPLLEGRYVWFRKMNLAAHKSLRIKVKVGVPSCQPQGTVHIQGIAYQLGGGGGVASDQILCSTVAAPSTINVRQPAKWGSNSKTTSKHTSVWWDDEDGCTTPTPAPSSTYTLVGQNQRCLEAELLGSRRRRRELSQGGGGEEEEEEEEEEETTTTAGPSVGSHESRPVLSGLWDVPADFFVVLFPVGS